VLNGNLRGGMAAVGERLAFAARGQHCHHCYPVGSGDAVSADRPAVFARHMAGGDDGRLVLNGNWRGEMAAVGKRLAFAARGQHCHHCYPAGRRGVRRISGQQRVS
jgi:hypothetical protein